MDANPPSTPQSELSSDANSNGNAKSDMLVPPRAKHGKAMAEDAKKKVWRNSGTVVHHKVSLINFYIFI